MAGATIIRHGANEGVAAADIGGTFTDVLLLDAERRLTPVKVLSTPPDFGKAVVSGISAALDEGAVDVDEVGAVLHATTVATNAILEMRGAETALITTVGFKDVLELARFRRPSQYDLAWEKPKPLVPRRHRFELQQRITSRGELEPAVSESEVRQLAELLRGERIQSVAVCLINSYLRPDQEHLVAEILREELPGVTVTASVDISPQAREYERTSSAVVNAYVDPVVRRYILQLRSDLEEMGLDASFRVMQSSGGLLDAESVVKRPAQIIESGPAAGMIAVQKLGEALGLDNVIAFDMGGTTAKAALIEGGELFVASEFEVGAGMNVTRGLGQGAGYMVRLPTLDIAEVGAGGGSIIDTDAAGALHVGPESASAFPGPACYGLGGIRPTLTDANVVLGYLSPEALAGGRVTIRPDLALDAVSGIADRLQLPPLEFARGAYEVAVSNMTTAVKAVTSERGRDPRNSVVVAFGGAGPLYAAELARSLKIKTIVVPVHPGLFSSLGLLVADIEREAVSGWDGGIEQPAALEAIFAQLTEEVLAELESRGHSREALVIERFTDVRYRSQRFELRIPVDQGTFDTDTAAAMVEQFHAEHLRTYGRRGSDDMVEVVNLRVRCGAVNPVSIGDIIGGDLPAGNTSMRSCAFDGRETVEEVRVIPRADLGAENQPGPLIVEDMDSTTLVPPGAVCHRDSFNNIVITWTED